MLRLPMLNRVALLLVAGLLAGCGSSSGSSSSNASGGGTVPAGASEVPASVQVFGTLDSSFGDQWNALNALVDRFPARGQLIASIHDSLSKDGVDFDKDIKATIGPEVDFAAWDLGADHPQVVGLTKAKDSAGFQKALAKGSSPSVSTEIDGWTVFADKQVSLDAFKKLSGGKLADDGTFKDAMGGLPDSALGRIYVNGTDLQKQLGDKLKSGGGSFKALGASGGKLQWTAAAVEAVEGGFKLDATVKTKDGHASNFNAGTLGKVPSTAFVVVAFDGSGDSSLGSQLKALEKDPSTRAGLQQFQTMSGVTLEDFARLFSGQGVLYARAGTPIPEVTIFETGVDTKKVIATLDTLGERLSAFTHATPQSVTIAGAKVRQITAGPVSVIYGDVDGTLVVTTSQAAITDLKSKDGKLVDDATFKKAESDAGVSGDNAALLYVDLQNAITTFGGLAQMGGQGGIPPDVQPNLENLRGLLFSAHADDKDTLQIHGFLGIKPGPAVPEQPLGTSTDTS